MTEKKKESGEISRRKFLKDAGLLVGGTAIGSTVLLAACAGETETETLTKTVTSTAPGGTATVTTTATKTVEVPVVQGNTVPQAYICWDDLLCTGCQVCQLICSTARRGRTSPSLAAIGHFHDDFGSDRDYEPCPCLQCEDPPCLKACDFDAMFIDPVMGIAVIDEEKCTGCGLCKEACPFSPPRIFGPDPVTNTKGFTPLFKCDLCYGAPLCVKWCPNGALKFKTLAEFTPEVVAGLPVEISYRLELLEEREKELGWPRGEEK